MQKKAKIDKYLVTFLFFIGVEDIVKSGVRSLSKPSSKSWLDKSSWLDVGSSGNALESFLFLNPCGGGVKSGRALLEADLSDGLGGDVDGGLEVCWRARLGAGFEGGFDAGLGAGAETAFVTDAPCWGSK